jgi:hypothetical protein
MTRKEAVETGSKTYTGRDGREKYTSGGEDVLRAVRTGRTKKENSDAGAAGEHFVIYQLLREYEVGGPYNQNGKHDLFVRVNGEWYTVQVKLGQLKMRNDGFCSLGLSGVRVNTITSDIVAVIDPYFRGIRWISNTKEVPEELARKSVRRYPATEEQKCQSMNTSAPRATTAPSRSTTSLTRSETASSAACVERN